MTKESRSSSASSRREEEEEDEAQGEAVQEISGHTTLSHSPCSAIHRSILATGHPLMVRFSCRSSRLTGLPSWKARPKPQRPSDHLKLKHSSMPTLSQA